METSTAPSSAARCSRNTSRSRFGDSAKRVIHRPAGLLTTRRRFQTKERVQLLSNGVSKQKSACIHLETAFSCHSLDPIRFSRVFDHYSVILSLGGTGTLPESHGNRLILGFCGNFLAYRFFFFNDTATTEIYTLSLHDALPIWLVI